jgi:hypothetical protein
MTTHDHHTEATHTRAEITPPTAQTEQLEERAVPSAPDADSFRGHPETKATGESSTGAASVVTSQPAPSVAPYDSPVVASQTATTGSHTTVAETGDATAVAESPTGRALFADDELAGLRARWDNVQAGFVDDPKDCVHKADGLVSDVVDQLTTGFTQARSRLEEHWSRGEEASTEDLRLALKGYRQFFERLLAV